VSGTIVIVTGPPGVGKTTAASAVAASYDRSAIVTGDHFFDALQSGRIEPWLPESHSQNIDVLDITLDTASGYASRGWTTVLEGIFGPWFLDTITERLADHEVHYAVLMSDLERCLSRFTQRDPGVGDDAARKMHHEFSTASIDAKHIIDASGSAEATSAELMRAIEGGRVQL